MPLMIYPKHAPAGEDGAVATRTLPLPATVRRLQALEQFSARDEERYRYDRSTFARLVRALRGRLRAQMERDPGAISDRQVAALISNAGEQLALAFAHDPVLIGTPVYATDRGGGVPDWERNVNNPLSGVVGTYLLHNRGAVGAAAVEQVLASPELARTRDPLARAPFGVTAAAHPSLQVDAWVAAVDQNPDLPLLRNDAGATAMGVAAHTLQADGLAFIQAFADRPALLALLALPGLWGSPRPAIALALGDDPARASWVVEHAPHLLGLPGSWHAATLCHELLLSINRQGVAEEWRQLGAQLVAAGHVVRQRDGRLVARGDGAAATPVLGPVGQESHEALLARVQGYTYHEEALPSRSTAHRLGSGR